MYSKFIVFTFLILSFHYSKAQKSFEPGYLVTSPGDTTRGFIDYKSWSRNPETISFKASPEEKTETYGLSDIEGFGVHGENYVKAHVEVNTSATEIDKLSSSPTPEVIKTVAFLLVVHNGPKGLFYLKDKDGKVHLYVRDKDGAYQLLINHRYLAANGQVVNVTYYREQLKNFFAECEGLVADQRMLPYSQQSIGKVFDRFYEKCSAQKVPATSYKPTGSSIQVGVVAGLASSKLSFEGSVEPELVNGDFPLSNKVSGGIFLNFVFPRLKQRASLYNELAFTSYKSSVASQTTFSDNSYSQVRTTFGFGYIKLINMVRYQIPVGGLKLFLNGGVTNGRAISVINERITEERFQTSAPTTTREVAMDGARKYEFGLIFGLGVNYKRLGIELRHETSDGMSLYNKLKSNIKRNYFLLSYRFLEK
ncbi:MAG: outer membrane beta-barrel protein [Dyadobacter sp.]|uniref:outer membrane beta-barrel protein n=1 Tax=Dyadobacter sp. TaxID=1914288 RepID=UPI001B2795DF|nr:outer membrane beta-barrel protein [Dyadobacter sp.]MBO9614477.1 outer membrane beta-barrel protein [Dyadobacter sp.]